MIDHVQLLRGVSSSYLESKQILRASNAQLFSNYRSSPFKQNSGVFHDLFRVVTIAVPQDASVRCELLRVRCSQRNDHNKLSLSPNPHPSLKCSSPRPTKHDCYRSQRTRTPALSRAPSSEKPSLVRVFLHNTIFVLYAGNASGPSALRKIKARNGENPLQRVSGGDEGTV